MSARSNSATFLEVPQHRRSLSPNDNARRRRSMSPTGGRSRSASPFDIRHCPGDLSNKVALFNKQVNDHLQYQAINPFSGDGRASPRPKLDKSDANYGKPLAGSKTAQRGQKAQSQVSKEILELCEVIAENGEALAESPEDDDCRVVISFGELFNIYTYISNKVVGILLRARKQKLVDFEGETLFQRKDDHVPIVLLKSIQEIRQIFRTAQEKEKQARMEEERRQYLQEHPELAEALEEEEEQKNSQNNEVQKTQSDNENEKERKEQNDKINNMLKQNAALQEEDDQEVQQILEVKSNESSEIQKDIENSCTNLGEEVATTNKSDVETNISNISCESEENKRNTDNSVNDTKDTTQDAGDIKKIEVTNNVNLEEETSSDNIIPPTEIIITSEEN